MKKSLLLAVLVSAAAMAPRAQAGISFGISIGPRYAPAPVYVAPPICAPAPRIVIAPAPIVVAPPAYYPPPVYYAPPPRVVVYGHPGYGRHYPHYRHHYYRRCD